jgi:hypothetical protein
MFAPGAQSSQCVSSFGEWLTPATLGTKITHRRDLRHHLRVVACAARQPHGRQRQRCGGALDRALHVR